MKFTVSLNYKSFVFQSLTGAGHFAIEAIKHSTDKDLQVRIDIIEEPEDVIPEEVPSLDDVATDEE